jgi:hypothetical protein
MVYGAYGICARNGKTVPEPPRGRPIGGGGVHRIRGYGGISPHLCISVNDFPYVMQSRKPVFAIDMGRWGFHERGRVLTLGAKRADMHHIIANHNSDYLIGGL